MSASLIVSDLEIAIASPSFVSLFVLKFECFWLFIIFFCVLFVCLLQGSFCEIRWESVEQRLVVFLCCCLFIFFNFCYFICFFVLFFLCFGCTQVFVKSAGSLWDN